ncbi:MAG: hypothetical protein AAF170_01595 [Bacteroidota bacterium]
MRLLLCSALLVSLAACQPSEPVGHESDSFFVLKDAYPTPRQLAIQGNGDAEQKRAIWRTHYEMIRPTRDALRSAISAETWTEGDRALRAFLADAHPDVAVQSRREVIAASGFLHGHLVNNDPLTRERQEAIAYYTTLLIENQTIPSITYLGPALDRLEGYWSNAKLAEARQLVAESTSRSGARTS